MDNQFLHVVRRVEQHLGTTEQADAVVTQDLRDKIARQPWTINFDNVADIYNARYWVRNFWKAAYFFAYEYSLTPTAVNRLAVQQSLDVVSVGGGSGADVLAFITWFNDAFPLTKLRITVIDGSQKQLDTLASFAKATSDLFDQVDVSIRYLHMHSDNWHPVADSADVLVFGHFLVENPHDVHALLQRAKDAVRAGGDVVVIERPNDAVIHHAKHVLANAGLTVYDITADHRRTELIKENLANLGTTGINSHYLRATQPDKKRKAEIVSKYFQAWRQQAIEPIHEIFSPHGSYQYKHNQSKPINNLDDMLKYWQAKPMAQSDIQVIIRNVTYAENVAICAFEGDLNTPTTHNVMKGSIAFYIDNYSNKIRHMSGHYGVVKTPL